MQPDRKQKQIGNQAEGASVGELTPNQVITAFVILLLTHFLAFTFGERSMFRRACKLFSQEQNNLNK